MGMNKKIDNAYLNQYTDNVIKRGYEIYDEWIEKKLDSRKIAASAESAGKCFKKRKNTVTFADALAYLFALDMRIKEKYNNIFRCLFSYFSWRRETRTLEALKSILNIPLGATDIRNAIEVEIERLAEKLETEWEEDGDDETHGGKRNGKAEEETASEEKATEETAEEKNESEEITDKEETKEDSEQKEDQPIEEAPKEEAKEEIGEKKEAAEPQESEKTETEEKEELSQEEIENLTEENNEPDSETELSTDIKEEAKAYNDAIDVTPFTEKAQDSKQTEKKLSFIDEMILDNMIKGDKSVMGYKPIEEGLWQNKDTGRLQDTVIQQKEENKSAEKEAYLYEKMFSNDKGEAQQLGNTEATQQNGKTSEVKTEQPKETTQKDEKLSQSNTEQQIKNQNAQPPTQENNPIREALSVDVNNAEQNRVIYELNNTMSLESKMAIVRMQEDMLREQLSISNQELGIDDRAGVIEVSEPKEVSPPSVVQSRK